MKNTLPENEKALRVLKTKGPQPISVVAGELGITVEGARFHLLKLEKEGLVESRAEAKGRGRPKQIWSLTASGNSRFPDTHAVLAANIITMIREALGEEALYKVIENHEQRMHARYAHEINGIPGLEERLVKLVEIRSKEGYMAEFERIDDGYLLVENHCPICEAAKVCNGFCNTELSIFKSVLGDEVRIERMEHIVKGGRRCSYIIYPN